MSTYSNMRLCLQVVYIANFQRLCHPRSAVWHILIRLYLNMGYHTKTQFHARFSRKNYDKELIFGIPYCSDEPAYILMLSSKQIHNRKHVEKAATQNLRASKQSPHQCPPQHWVLRWQHKHTKGLLAAWWRHPPTSCCWWKKVGRGP